MSRAKIVVASAGVAAVALCAAPWIARWSASASVTTVVVASGPFERRVLAEGNLEAAEATPVTAPLDLDQALKIAWLVPDGSSVKSGDVVVRFDPTETERSLRDGESDRSSTDSKIAGTRAETGGMIHNLERDAAMARSELAAADRFKTDDPDVFARQEIIRSQIDRALSTKRIETADDTRTIKQSLATVDLDLLDIERRKSGIAIERAKKVLDALEIKAPHDGLLVYKRDWRGDIKKVGDPVYPGQAVAEIPDLSTLQARVYVLEADAGGLVSGLPAKVTIEAHPDTVYDATVKTVDALAQRRFGSVPVQYFATILALASTDAHAMKPGERVQAVLSLDPRKDAISLPRSAVVEKNGKKVVYRRSGSSFAAVEVALGPAGVGRVVIESGLAAGDVVALSDPTAPSAGVIVPAASGSASPTAIKGGR